MDGFWHADELMQAPCRHEDVWHRMALVMRVQHRRRGVTPHACRSHFMDAESGLRPQHILLIVVIR